MSGVLSEQEVADLVAAKGDRMILARSHEALRAERDELRKLLARVVRENCEFSDDPPRVRGFDPHRDTDLSDEETNLLRRALAEGES